MSRPRVAVLRGGPSDEYEVSLRTGNAVLAAIDQTKFVPLDVVITKTGEWLFEGRTRYPEHIIPAVDVVFIALHGAYGEDGTLQRVLERFGVPYTGSGPYASGVAMHKALTKDHLRSSGLSIPQHVVLERSDHKTGRQYAGEIRELFGPEYIIKPVRSGSSVGMVHVQDPLHLGQAIEDVLGQHSEILVEEYIRGREFTCGVIERYRNAPMYVLPPVEIIPPPTATFFNAQVKYDGSTQEICPATLPRNEKKRIEEMSEYIHTALNLRQYSRSDFILRGNQLYFLEVNTLPGLTTESLFPKALTAIGSSYNEFIEHLLNDALHHV